MDDNAANYISRIKRLGHDEEVELLNGILREGYDQGCFLSPNPEDLLPAGDMAALDAIMDALKERELAPDPSIDDPFQDVPLPTATVDDVDAGFVILSQRCDLVRALRVEPFVELVAVHLERDKSMASIAKRNSPRLISVADHPDGVWVADLRRRVLIAKDRLTNYDSRQLVSAGEQHKRFKLRVGQRYSRDALPADLVECLQRPIVKLLSKSSQLAKVEPFSELLVFRQEDKVEILAVYPAHVDRKVAEDAWQEFEDALPAEVAERIAESSGAVSITQLHFYRYFSGWKMDLDEVTYHRKAKPEQSSPSL